MKLLQNIQRYDVSAFNWCLRRKNRNHMVSMARWVSKTADGHLYAITVFVLLMLQEHRLFLLMVSAFGIERSLYFILKKGCRRNRPPEALPNYKSVIVPGDQFSFPSGHTSAAFLMATLLSTMAPNIGIAFFLWAASVGASRVVLGVHFPTDTLAGAVLGITLAQATTQGFASL